MKRLTDRDLDRAAFYTQTPAVARVAGAIDWMQRLLIEIYALKAEVAELREKRAA